MTWQKDNPVERRHIAKEAVEINIEFVFRFLRFL